MNLNYLRPERTEWTNAEAYSWCLDLARRHYENFPVASFLLPARLRPHVAAVYAFARIADDLADEPGLTAEQRTVHLGEWETMLASARDGQAGHPVFVALAATMRDHSLPYTLFSDLLSAFRQDVVQQRYDTYADVLEYCRRSANPVGRLMLRLFGNDDERLDRYSDDICTALQLTNFWQDFSQDLGRGRIYVPLEDLDRFGVPHTLSPDAIVEQDFRELIAFEVERTRELFRTGKPLLNHPKTGFSLQLRVTWHGGMRVLDKIERTGYNVMQYRPKLVGIDAAVIGYRALVNL